MKKILITVVALALAVPALAAQQDIAQISAVTASREALRTAVNTQLSAVQANFDEIYTAVGTRPWVIQATAPADTTLAWFDTDQVVDAVVLKIHNGERWAPQAIGEGGSYTLPTAAADTLGGVKVGARLTITDGVLSADVQTGGGDDLGSAAYSDIVALWTTCTGYLKSDGTCDTPSGSATYPSAAGVANWNGSAWGTSYTVGTSANNLVQLNASAQLPAVSAALLTNFPTLNQNTTGTAGGLTGTPNITVGTISAGAAGFGVDADGDATAKTMTAGSYLSSAADGSRYSTLPNNTSGNAPAAAMVVNGFYTYINELYAVENSGTASKVLLENDVDDTPVDGATAAPVSSNRMYDHENAADPHTGYVLESALGSGTLTMLGSSPGAEGGPTTTIEAGTSALGTSEIASGACASAVTTAATNAATTDVINWGFNGDPTGVAGYAPTANGMLTIIAYPSSGNVNFKVCNLTAAAITPGAITLNWRIQR